MLGVAEPESFYFYPSLYFTLKLSSRSLCTLPYRLTHMLFHAPFTISLSPWVSSASSACSLLAPPSKGYIQLIFISLVCSNSNRLRPWEWLLKKKHPLRSLLQQSPNPEWVPLTPCLRLLQLQNQLQSRSLGCFAPQIYHLTQLLWRWVRSYIFCDKPNVGHSLNSTTNEWNMIAIFYLLIYFTITRQQESGISIEMGALKVRQQISQWPP